MTIESQTSGFLHHLRGCNNAVLPGRRLAFLLNDAQVGWVTRAFAQALTAWPEVTLQPGGASPEPDAAALPQDDVAGDPADADPFDAAPAEQVVLRDPAALPDIVRGLAAQGRFRLRNEAFDVRAVQDGPVLGRIDRGALPSFGVVAVGAHLNGLVRRSDGLHVWIARRAADRMLDPGKLDHLTAGGVSAGLTPEQTLVKEAGEEAAIPAALARQARQVGTIRYAMERPEGLRRDLLYCYDLELGEDFVPRATDGEAEGFELWPIARVFETVRDTDAFKFNVNLVLIDLFLRQGLIPPAEAGGLRALLDAGRC